MLIASSAEAFAIRLAGFLWDVQVLDTHLQTREWLAANQFTIADISNFTWVYGAAYSGQQY